MNKKSIAVSVIAFAAMISVIAFTPASADAYSPAPYYQYPYEQDPYAYQYDYSNVYGTTYGCDYMYSYNCGYEEVVYMYDLPTYYTDHTFAPYTPVTYTFENPVYYSQQPYYTAPAPTHYTQPTYYTQPQTYYQQPTYSTGYGYNTGNSAMSQRVYGTPTGRTNFFGTPQCDYSFIGYNGDYDCDSDPRQPVRDSYTGQWY